MNALTNASKELFEKVIIDAGFYRYEEQDYLQGDDYLGIKLYASELSNPDVIYRLEDALSSLSGKCVKISGVVLKEKPFKS